MANLKETVDNLKNLGWDVFKFSSKTGEFGAVKTFGNRAVGFYKHCAFVANFDDGDAMDADDINKYLFKDKDNFGATDIDGIHEIAEGDAFMEAGVITYDGGVLANVDTMADLEGHAEAIENRMEAIARVFFTENKFA